MSYTTRIGNYEMVYLHEVQFRNYMQMLKIRNVRERVKQRRERRNNQDASFVLPLKSHMAYNLAYSMFRLL